MTAVDAFPHLRELVPLLDAALAVDDVVAIAPGDGSSAALTLASGTTVEVRASGVGNALRLQAGPPPIPEPSPLLIAFDETPVSVSAIDGGVSLSWGGHSASWTVGDGLVHDRWRTAPTTGMGGDSPALFGRLLADGEPTGWLVSTSLGPDESVFGGGESFASVDQRGRIRRCMNDETHGVGGLDVSYLNVPFFWSTDHRGVGWGVLVHTGGSVVADLGATHTDIAALVVDGPGLDVFVTSGDPASHLGLYHQVSGLPGSVPDWAFGTWSSRCSYFSEDELHDVVDGYAAAGIALDVVHVDCWLEGNTIRDLTCNWTIDRTRFPDGWVGRLEAKGVRVSLWHNPYVLADTPLADDLHEHGLLLCDRDGNPARTADKDDRVIVDLTHPAGAAWWRGKVTQTLQAEGNHSFKPDFAEEVPLDAVAHDGRSGRSLRNEYSVRYQAATHEALVTERGEAVLFCRSGTTGAQRYPGHWVGDTPSTWAGLAQALRACLSLSLSGFGVVTSDTGGFYVAGSWDDLFAAADSEDESHYRADVDHDLFVRWAQWSALSPLLRFHGTGRREPWAYPADVCDPVRAAVDLRERLRPYLVEVAAEAAATGTPMMRPPALHDATVPGASSSLQYLLGPDVLVAPLLTAECERRVWMPAGEWEPLLGLDSVTGDRWIDVSCDRHQFPAWVRTGSRAEAPVLPPPGV